MQWCGHACQSWQVGIFVLLRGHSVSKDLGSYFLFNTAKAYCQGCASVNTAYHAHAIP